LPEEASEAIEVQRPARVLPRTEVYPRSAARPVTSAPSTPGRRLLSVLGKGEPRPVSSLLHTMSPAELVAASSELLDEGYAFERVGSGIKLRFRARGESRQTLADVWARLDLFGKSGSLVPAHVETSPVREDFDPGEDVGDPVDESNSLVLSCPPSDLSLPVAGCSTTTRAVLARRGSGKTYLAGVIVEEMLSRPGRGSVLVVDPGGAWWGLLSDASGGPSSLPILLLGGRRGHLPVKAGDGARVAEVLFEMQPLAVLLDLSELAPVEQHGVVADLFERLWSLGHFLLHAVIDEADEFAPQRFGALPRHQRRSLDQLSRAVMRGRVRGMGATLVTLRPAVLSKNLLSQVDEVCLGCFVEPSDIRAATSWLENHEDHVTDRQRAECLGQLPVLPAGVFYYLRGGEAPAFRRFRTRAKRTYDSSRTLTADFRAEPHLGRPAQDVLAKVAEIMARREVSVDEEDGDG